MFDYLNMVVPAVVTIIGFIVTYFTTRHSIKEEIHKQKTGIYLEELSKVPMEVLTLMDDGLNQIGIKIDMYRQEHRFSPATPYI